MSHSPNRTEKFDGIVLKLKENLLFMTHDNWPIQTTMATMPSEVFVQMTTGTTENKLVVDHITQLAITAAHKKSTTMACRP